MKVKLGDYIKEYSVRNKNNEDIPVYSVTNTQGFCRDYFGKEVASKNKTTYKIVPKGYFAYNPSRVNVGSIDWQREEEMVIVSPLYNIFSVSQELDQQYLYYYLKSDITLFYIKSFVTGSVRDNLKFDMLCDFPINLPNLDEQKRIVKVLDNIRKQMELRRQQLNSFDELIKARFVELFGDPMVNPNRYPLKKYGEIFELNAGGTPSKSKPEYWKNGTISWIGSNLCQNVVLYENDGKYISQEGYEHSSARLFPIDTVLIALVGATIGKTALLKFETSTNQNVLGVRNIVESGYNPVFVYYYTQLLYQKFMNIGDGGFNMASKGFVSELPMYDVDLSAQNEFVAFAEQVDKSKVVVQKSLNEVQLLFDSLMQEYFG